jgi:hypothetical protein
MKRAPSVRVLGILGALLVPALAVAAFNLPHAFQSGEVLTAANLNNNFNAVKTELEALQARVTMLENASAAKTDLQALTTRVTTLETNSSSKTDVQALQSRVTTVEGTSAELSRVSLSKCKWHWEPCNIPMFEECVAQCPANTFALAGGCDSSNATSISEHRPAPAVYPPFPPSGAPAKDYDKWVCESSDGTFQNSYVLCCAF